MKLSLAMKRKRNEQVDKLLEKLGIKVIWVNHDEAKEYIAQGCPCFSYINGIPVFYLKEKEIK